MCMTTSNPYVYKLYKKETLTGLSIFNSNFLFPFSYNYNKERKIFFYKTEVGKDGKSLIGYYGISTTDKDNACPECGSVCNINRKYFVTIKSICFSGFKTYLKIERIQFRCPKCGKTHLQHMPFRDIEHRITPGLRNYIEYLLSSNTFTYKQISDLTNVDKNVLIKINDKRLRSLYTENGSLKKPSLQSQYLSVDEFLLHKNRKYATIIIDLESGQILWVAKGKKKQVVYDFIQHVGLSWMAGVKAVACDMNSDYEEAFLEMCPHIKIVNDRFHIVKYFNDHVVNAIRKDLLSYLKDHKDQERINILKGSKFILTSNIETLMKKDSDGAKGSILQSESTLFKIPRVKRHGGYLKRYQHITAEFPIFKEVEDRRYEFKYMYESTSPDEFYAYYNTLVEECKMSENKHLQAFGKLLERHEEGIKNYAQYRISSGKIEGTNQRIKTMRRSAYGLPNDERFFLRLLDLRHVA